jgi:superfamily II DNA or RNA helicase
MTYEEFLNTKKISHILSGFTVDESELNPLLFPFQKFCVKRALEAGKYALFADTGMGKTVMQLEFAQKVIDRELKSVLILAPLAVVGQTINEGIKFGYEVTEIESETSGTGIYITNYENLEKINVSEFAGIVLDESSILKNFDGKTKQKLIDLFSKTPYKLACTATPSPNDVMELCNHAEFLDVMSRNEMLAMYFVHDGGCTTKWRLKGHSERVFWDFVSTWAMMITTPSDIGFPDEEDVFTPVDDDSDIPF